VHDTFKSGEVQNDVQAAVDQVQTWLLDAINVTRNLSMDISPSILRSDGMREAVHWLAARMKEQHGLVVNLDVKDELLHLPDSLRVTLFQAMRELLFNVVKHAGTLEASLTLDGGDGHGTILIDDSGNGFDSRTILSDPQAAHGLMIVRDRLNLVGGTLDISSTPGNGTHVTIQFPLSDPLTA
jgi:signal transduction histidine kinase